MTHHRLIPASLLTTADIDKSAAETSLSGLLTMADALASHLEATALGAFRHEEKRAADEAMGLVLDAAGVLRAARDGLRQMTAADLMDELIETAGDARAESRRVA